MTQVRMLDTYLAIEKAVTKAVTKAAAARGERENIETELERFELHPKQLAHEFKRTEAWIDACRRRHAEAVKANRQRTAAGAFTAAAGATTVGILVPAGPGAPAKTE